MHLRDGAVEPPAGAHLAPVDDVALHYRGEFHDISDISVITEIIALPEISSRGSARRWSASRRQIGWNWMDNWREGWRMDAHICGPGPVIMVKM